MRPVAPSPHAVVLGHGPGAAAWPAPGLGTRLRALSIEGRWRLTPADAEPLPSRDAALTHLRTVGVPIGADALAGGLPAALVSLELDGAALPPLGDAPPALTPRLHRLAGPSDDLVDIGPG